MGRKTGRGAFLAHAAGGLLLALSVPAVLGAGLRSEVRSPDGAPIADAVVTLEPEGHSVPARPPGPVPLMRQKGERFEPYVLAIPVGSAVRFPNEDPFRHHVFSFSPVKPFEIRLYGRDEVPEVRFERPGVVALGCNIHDEMRGYVYVVSGPEFMTTGADGTAELPALPPGAYTAQVWHPGLKSREPAVIRQAVTVPAGPAVAVVRFTVKVGAPNRPAPPDRERVSY